uniref:Ig-like domain-containing protein n=1 Tax=Esox lucius TaxID=8010 RepID=A0A3P8ZMA6_ESOLU
VCCCFLIVVHSFPECRGEDTVTQPTRDVITTEGEQVTLDCTFNAVNPNNVNLFWYKYEPNGFPKVILGRFPFGSTNTTEFKARFDALLNSESKSVPLTIQRLQLSDSAVYYCALRPTVTTGYTAPTKAIYINFSEHCIYLVSLYLVSL